MTMQQSISAAFAAVGADIKAMRASIPPNAIHSSSSGRGSHSRYIRFADGTLIVWGWMNTGQINVPAGEVRDLGHATWSFPARFVEGPVVSCQVYGAQAAYFTCGYGSIFNDVGPRGSGGPNYTRLQQLWVRSHATTQQSVNLMLTFHAFGRWK
ncbi:hypothetical protein CLI92_06010 [Vandammella animalimorsus]|uniref:Uncharacterized protein n=1 Tax=Vandammella animalimorsus TaxID=2029117 RepID=A0A2A2T676_9BURK|nr:hypothetical protein [Vandammella animalimorsus]PAX17099.1 hypothetical protein CLI92_06010 [Vandammella animalimorsus]PAX19072.1 hypothetical protein CLI93_09940 [Vandammella animalimorsus]